jgi:hypothetical protein
VHLTEITRKQVYDTLHHGSISKRKDEHVTPTPMEIGPEQRVFLRVPSIRGYPRVCLLDELTDAARQHERESNLEIVRQSTRSD